MVLLGGRSVKSGLVIDLMTSSFSSDTRYHQALKQLKKVWGYPALRSGQDQAVAAILQGKDTLVVLPTGGGKSICFQLPALCMEGMCLVISPLIALMQDQVRQLKAKGVAAVSISSDLNSGQIEQLLLNARNGMYKLLYVSPERLSTALFQRFLPDLTLSFLAVDESHCISEWGHEFRPSYRTIVASLPENIQKVAVTATATPKVRKDIAEVLHMKEAEVVSGDFIRPNLHWWASERQRPVDAALRAVQKAQGSGLIFCATRKKTHFFAERMQQLGISSEAYHAGLDNAHRKAIQNQWIDNKIKVVACTNAFGMGIDKPDCRFVIHAHLPSSLEAYYQEAGRAGRDLQTAYPLLFFSQGDYERQKKQIEDQYPSIEELQKMYDVLCDGLDLSIGQLPEQSDWLKPDLQMLSKRAKWSTYRVLKCLRRLDDIQLIQLQEQVGLTMYALQRKSHADSVSQRKRAFLDRLFRVAGPLFDHDGWVSAKSLAEVLDLRPAVLERSLQVLANESLIELKSFTTPLALRLLEPRQKNPDFKPTILQKQLKLKLEKLHWVLKYAQTRNCRSQFVASYFGQFNSPACGVCDNCKKAQKEHQAVNVKPMTLAEFSDALPNEWTGIEEFRSQLDSKRISPQKMQQFMHQLKAEGLLLVEGDRLKRSF